MEALQRITPEKINFPVNTELVSHSQFYATYPAFLQPFAQQWLRKWLQWFDGYVDGVHDSTGCMVSTRLAATLCHRIAQSIFGGGLLFSKKGIKGKKESENKALKFISGDYNDEIGLDDAVLQAFLFAAAGGTSFVVENTDSDGKMWLQVYRMDEGYFNINYKGEVVSARLINSKYVDAVGEGRKTYILIEERYKGNADRERAYNKKFKDAILTAKMPSYKRDSWYVEYNIYETTALVNNQPVQLGRPIGFTELPARVQDQIRESYGDIRIGEPKRLPFTNIGIRAFKFTQGVDNLTSLPYGQSLVQDIQAELFSYDYQFSAFNTDVYLGRGRVLVPKAIQNPKNKNQASQNAGLDSFLYTQYEGQKPDDQKPTPIQFDLRSVEWENIKNNLLETMAMKIGLSPSTLAGWLNGGSNRTAREISSEESETANFVNGKRKLFTKVLNALVQDILLYNGQDTGVEVKFSKSGETNVTLVLENTTSAYNAGLKSLYLSVKAINPDMSEDELQEEIARIKADANARAKMNQTFDVFNENVGDFDNEQEENSEGEANRAELADSSD